MVSNVISRVELSQNIQQKGKKDKLGLNTQFSVVPLLHVFPHVQQLPQLPHRMRKVPKSQECSFKCYF